MLFVRLAILVLLPALGLLPLAQPAYAQIWSYDGDQNNQDEWATLSNDYAVCESGKQQSPIQIGTTQKGNLPPLAFHYGDTKAQLKQKDYTLTVDIQSNNTLIENGKTYRLAQLRFHTPSEHMLLDHFWPLEIELMHQDADGKMLIVSVFANIGQSNPALQMALDHISGKMAVSDITFSPQLLIPPIPRYYSYSGSLTIPPCTEGVEWRIFKESISISQKQLSALEKITGRNARLPQPIYMRTIIETGE